MKRFKYGGLLCSVIILLSLVLSVGFAGNAYAEWTISTIATPSGTDLYDREGLYSAIAVDSNNKAHISYTHYNTAGSGYYQYALYYATNKSGSWTTKNLKPNYTSHLGGKNSSIAIASDDTVRIAYQDRGDEWVMIFDPIHNRWNWQTESRDGISYATNESGSWGGDWIYNKHWGYCTGSA